MQVTLHNNALVAAAEEEQGSGVGGGGVEAALRMLRHLLAHPPCPPETLPNLLLLYCRCAALATPISSLALQKRVKRCCLRTPHRGTARLVAARGWPRLANSDKDRQIVFSRWLRGCCG